MTTQQPPRSQSSQRSQRRPQATPQLIDGVVAALLPPTSPIALGSPEARERRDVQQEVDRQIGRALWRAERRARQVPKHVRQSLSFVMSRRRKIAYEVSRAVRALGAGDELSDAIAERAAMRFPRDGVVLPDSTARPERPGRPEQPLRPRARGESPRQLGTEPRARGTNPRALGKSPRQERAKRTRLAPADLTGVDVADLHSPELRAEAAPVVPPPPPEIDDGRRQTRASPEVQRAGMALIFDSMYEDHQLIRAMRSKGASDEKILETKRALNRAAVNASAIYSKGANASTPRKVDRRKPLR